MALETKTLFIYALVLCIGAKFVEADRDDDELEIDDSTVAIVYGVSIGVSVLICIGIALCCVYCACCPFSKQRRLQQATALRMAMSQQQQRPTYAVNTGGQQTFVQGTAAPPGYPYSTQQVNGPYVAQTMSSAPPPYPGNVVQNAYQRQPAYNEAAK